MLLITLGGRGISHKRLKLELPQHSSPEARHEISRIWGEVILGCFDALADDIQVKGERESHQAITDRPLDNCSGKQTSVDPEPSSAKGKPVRESTGKEGVNEAAEPEYGVRTKAGNITLKNGITRDGADTGMAGQSKENIAEPNRGDSQDGNPEPVSSAVSPRQLPSGPSEEEAILHFLETGAAHFTNRLKDALDMKSMVKRLTRRFPEAIIEKMLEALAPGRGRSTRAVIRWLDACYAAGTGVKLGKDPGNGADTVLEIKDHVWEHMLLITLGGHDISHKRLKLELPQHSSPKARQKSPGSGGRSSWAVLTPWQMTFRSRGNGNHIKPLRIVLWTTARVSRHQ